jgi:nucleotide-binding universal stress UspA family protein
MKQIICAYDFSDASVNALNHAARYAEYFNATLSLVYIYNIPVPVTEFGYIDVGDEVVRKNAEKDLAEIKNRVVLEHPMIKEMNVIVETGLVSYKLNKLAKEKAADLVVMGIDNDKSFVKEHLLGSTSIDEAREFRIPVLIVPKSSESKKINNIAYASDYKHTEQNNTSLIQVKYFATLFSAPLSVLHVLEPNHELNAKEINADKFIEQQFSHTDHKTFFVYEKNVADGIIEFVESHEVDLIIVEPYQRNFFERLFQKSTTKELAFRLNRPILAIHGD